MKNKDNKRFYIALQSNMENIDTVYDLTALCYGHIIDVVKNQQKFIGEYILTNRRACISNPNIKALRVFSKAIERVLEKQEKEGCDFEECLKTIIKRVGRRTEAMKDYGDFLMNDATIAFFLLQAIDRYVLYKRERCTNSAPLNKLYYGKVYIYLNVGHNILDEAMESLEFSDIVRDLSVRGQLRHFTILEKRELPRSVKPPKLVSLFVDDEDGFRKNIERGKRWNVAIIPFGKHDMITFPVHRGASFHIEYKKEHLIQGKERAICLLDKAIDEGANVIVFPEYICHPQIHEAIQEHLRYLYEHEGSRMRGLFMVIAGSGWYRGNNNIAYLYSYNGILLGKQYKYARYHKGRLGRDSNVEHLETPGRESTIVNIEGIGRCMTAICRDISDRGYDGSYAHILAETFCPMFLFVPAWSASVNIGFMEQFKDIVSRNHMTSSILCNCCEAFRGLTEFKEKNGIVVTPYKKESLIIGKEDSIERSKKKCDTRCHRGGCVYLICMEFEENAVKDGRIIRSIEQKFA